MTTRPIPDEDPTGFPEPGTDPDVPKEPGPAPGPEDPQELPRRDDDEDAVPAT